MGGVARLVLGAVACLATLAPATVAGAQSATRSSGLVLRVDDLHRLRPGASLGLPAFPFPVVSDDGAEGAGARELRARRAAPRPFRAGEALPLGLRSPGGPSLYGVLAGRALASALHLHGSLPAGASPWFDGDPERMVAGFELSF